MTDRMKPADHPPHLSDESPFWTRRLELPLEPAAVHVARAHAQATLSEWAIEPGVIEDALLIVSELATNAVRHSQPPESGGQFVLTLIHLPETLQIYLADDDPRPPVMQHPAENATGGRGLLLVSELSAMWGCRLPLPGQGSGKAVVAELRLVESSPGEAATAWDAGPMPPIPVANPFTRARVLSSIGRRFQAGEQVSQSGYADGMPDPVPPDVVVVFEDGSPDKRIGPTVHPAPERPAS